jgi:hypothetical protein
MKLEDYKLPELRTVAKYLEIEGYNKMRRADLEAQGKVGVSEEADRRPGREGCCGHLAGGFAECINNE